MGFDEQGSLLGKTYTAPPNKWAVRLQSREMLQFGVFTHSNRVQDVGVLPMPPILTELVQVRPHRVARLHHMVRTETNARIA